MPAGLPSRWTIPLVLVASSTPACITVILAFIELNFCAHWWYLLRIIIFNYGIILIIAYTMQKGMNVLLRFYIPWVGEWKEYIAQFCLPLFHNLPPWCIAAFAAYHHCKILWKVFRLSIWHISRFSEVTFHFIFLCIIFPKAHWGYPAHVTLPSAAVPPIFRPQAA